MATKVLAVLIALLLAAGLVYTGVALADANSIQDSGSGTAVLNSRGEAPEQAHGTIEFDLNDRVDGTYRVRSEIEVRDLPERAGRVYEVWLIDDTTGYELSLTAFNTDNDGDERTTVTRNFVFFAPFDRVVVTSEPRDGRDPTLTGDTVLEGDLP